MKFIINSLLPMAVALVCLYPLNIFAKSPINAYVSILPQKYFVERIGRDRVHVDVLVKPGKNPATYSPTPAQIKGLTSSDVYFRIGVPFENGILQRIESITGIRVVDTREGIALRQMEEDTENHEQDAGHHGDKAGLHHVGGDPHIWMSPVLLKTQAYTVFQALTHIDPDGKNEYKINYELFVKDLDDLDNRLKTAFKDFKGKNVFVFHPSFGYFTDAYGLRQIPVETMGKAPKGKALSNIIKSAKKQKAQVIFVQPQFDLNAARKIASAINGAVVSIDPLAYDYIINMEYIAQTIAGALKNVNNYAQRL